MYQGHRQYIGRQVNNNNGDISTRKRVQTPERIQEDTCTNGVHHVDTK